MNNKINNVNENLEKLANSIASSDNIPSKKDKLSKYYKNATEN